jgi:hypothetical protein
MRRDGSGVSYGKLQCLGADSPIQGTDAPWFPG